MGAYALCVLLCRGCGHSCYGVGNGGTNCVNGGCQVYCTGGFYQCGGGCCQQSSGGGGGGGGCFPETATARLSSGRIVAVADLRVGDSVQVSARGSKCNFGLVYIARCFPA